VRVLTRTTVIGAFDHGIYGAVERVSDHLKTPDPGKPRQILWRIYTKQTILCSGATERSIVFENNDRPGIILSGAIRNYVNRWAVTPNQNVAIFTNNNDGHQTARALINKGVNVAAVIDTRKQKIDSPDYETFSNSVVSNTNGRLGLESINIKHEDGTQRTVKCGALGVSGGWNPNIHISSHHRGRPIWNEAIQSFIPDDNSPSGMLIAGSAKGFMELEEVIRSGFESAKQALAKLNVKSKKIDLPKTQGDEALAIEPFWMVQGTSRGWVDQQNDVTAKDIKLAKQENFTSVEHLKRYTTLGMATDQGKTANISGLAIMANLLGKPIPEVGTTIYRPPYTPTAIGAFAGRSRDKDFRPVRKTPSHIWAEEKGAVFVEVGMWMRAQWFPEKGETHWRQSVDREVLQTRKSVGVCDVTTLGKVDVQGKDAASFLNLIYCNGFAKLAIGKTRYGLMLREDGIALDDGTAARLDENHFVVTTTTANAVSVYRHMEFVRQCLYPKMDVQLISTTEAWAQFAIAGPNSRSVLRKIVDKEYDISNEGFPFMACGQITVCGGLRARLFRISFSGELAYELAVPTRYGDSLIREIMKAGEEFDIVPYGTEALGVMRIEKGHAAGNELNGTTSALNLGMGRMVSKKKDSIGNVMSEREGLNTQDALKLVGFMPVNKNDRVPAGSHLMSTGSPVDAAHDQGYITSACFSPNLNCHIGIGFLKAGDTRIGEVVRLVSPLTGQDHNVQVVSAHFIDPEGERLRA
jgi:heterotetrameric sarcosine oxidase alpha subunit